MRDITIGILLGVVLGCLFSPRCSVRSGAGVSHSDTIIIRDTLLDTVPLLVRERVIDSIPYPIDVRTADTVVLVDTIYLPRTQREYSGTQYRAWVSGYDPRLDSISIFEERKVIRMLPKPKRWTLGVSAGYGISKNGLSPFIGVGISYRLVEF